jgi:hypothetical protein
MLINNRDLEGIVSGKIQLAFRRWKKPTVKTGGRLRTHLGVLSIQAVDAISESDITERDSKLAGFSSKGDLLDHLKTREGALYRIELSFKGPDERIELRSKGALAADEWTALRQKLERLDAKSVHGPWVAKFLNVVSNNPGILSTTLAASLGLERKWFKEHMRKLKELGLTESLEIGYRISPRGKAVIKKLR